MTFTKRVFSEAIVCRSSVTSVGLRKKESKLLCGKNCLKLEATKVMFLAKFGPTLAKNS